MKVLATQRLQLVPVDARNARVLWMLLRAPGLREFQDLPALDAEHFQRTVERRARQLVPGALGRFEWLVYRKEARTPLGWISLRMQDRDPESGEIGYSILAPERNQGIATEAVRAVIMEGFAAAGLARIKAFCVPENVPSRVVLEKIGFDKRGIIPHGATVAGRPVDIVAFVLDR